MTRPLCAPPRRYTPYTTDAGIKIGGAYTPAPDRMSQDAELIQLALLERRKRDTCCQRNGMPHGCRQGRDCPEKASAREAFFFVACVLCIVAVLLLSVFGDRIAL